MINYVCKGSIKTRDKRTKGEKSLKSFVISYILCPFVPDNEPLNRLVAQRREFFDKQIIAEWGNENRCQFVTQFFLNPRNCLYLQKVCDFIQRYKIKLKNNRSCTFFSKRRKRNALQMRFTEMKEGMSFNDNGGSSLSPLSWIFYIHNMWPWCWRTDEMLYFYHQTRALSAK